MRQYLLAVIAVLTAIILALFTIDTKQGSTHTQVAYRYVEQPITGILAAENMPVPVVESKPIPSVVTDIPDSALFTIPIAHNEMPSPVGYPLY